ncbi:unnamed protein product [Anisakis simplex]|uniref:SCP domain-containing protein n=1 Tax=Anisakis simplex TaxID=6269 RepID=A0A0M3K1U4_ANISI|nr:unnamed protein product [Anisakis simplex]
MHLKLLTSVTAQWDCPNSLLTPAAKQAIVAKHNELRETIVHGKALRKGDVPIPKAANMYAMKWDCDLEKQSQEWVNRCVFQHSPESFRHAGENIFASSTTGSLGDLGKYGVTASEAWWSELKRVTDDMIKIENNEVPFGGPIFGVAGHWTQMAWGETTKVGCGIQNCTRGTSGWKQVNVVCEYRNQGNFWSAPIYKIGDGCHQDSDCTSFQGSKCDTSTNLCLSP